MLTDSATKAWTCDVCGKRGVQISYASQTACVCASAHTDEYHHVPPTDLPKIFCFINSGRGTEWVITYALAEDGTPLASHCSSSEAWARHDIGYASQWHYDIYFEHYPKGFEVIWVSNEEADARSNVAFEAAVELVKLAPPKDATTAIVEGS